MATNDITGDRIKSKPANDQYRSEYERIFGKPEKGEKFYCSTHRRFTLYKDAKGRPCCDPSLPGITMPCVLHGNETGKKK